MPSTRNYFRHRADGCQSAQVPKLLDVRAAADLLGLSRWSIYVLCEQGKIPHFRLGGRIRFSEPRLAGWLQAQSHGDEARIIERISTER